MKRKPSAMALVAFAVCMVSYSGPMVKGALNAGASPLSVAFVRMLAAGLLLCGPAQALWPRFKAALYDRRPAGWAQTAVLLALGFACLVLLVSGTYNPFIYFRF